MNQLLRAAVPQTLLFALLLCTDAIVAHSFATITSILYFSSRRTPAFRIRIFCSSGGILCLVSLTIYKDTLTPFQWLFMRTENRKKKTS